MHAVIVTVLNFYILLATDVFDDSQGKVRYTLVICMELSAAPKLGALCPASVAAALKSDVDACSPPCPWLSGHRC